MNSKFLALLCMAALEAGSVYATKVNTEKTITVNGVKRKYILYVPNKLEDKPALVVSLHGASGHDTDYSPFKTNIADAKGCIVVYPQGRDQYFPIFGGSVAGWNANGEYNEDVEFFQSIIDEVKATYSIDESRVFCCGFSNGGMMTYAVANATDGKMFSAYASISGFPLNEFHLRTSGAKAAPFLHIHGKNDDFVKYSCTPIIRDNMVARNGANPVPVVNNTVGSFTRSTYKALDGGTPYVFYEVDGMGHVDFTSNTADSNSALTMWRFFNNYNTITESGVYNPDESLRWQLNIDAEGFDPAKHHWTVSSDKTRFSYGSVVKPNNADNNVCPSIQFAKGNYTLEFAAEGTEGHNVYVQLERLTGAKKIKGAGLAYGDNDDNTNVTGSDIPYGDEDASYPAEFTKVTKVGETGYANFSVAEYGEYKITIVKEDANDKMTALRITTLKDGVKVSADAELPAENQGNVEETGTLIEIPQSQGKEYDNFARTSVEAGDGYTTYTATSDLQIAIKMMNIDVTDCDYVLIKFAEPVAAGWHLAFWSDQTLRDVPEGSTEYKFDLEDGMKDTGILPQICMMTFFGGYTAPLEAKVVGIYKHSTKGGTVNAIEAVSDAEGVEAFYSLSGARLAAPVKGVNVVKMKDGRTKKVVF
ncbi:MAG: prolyl oligopeptidase family serine peptidase [Bacteroidaceae bacterium]|nr:prolyl oligopeptidase family serine peptidase [Bacteroidaceae bacterium]